MGHVSRERSVYQVGTNKRHHLHSTYGSEWIRIQLGMHVPELVSSKP